MGVAPPVDALLSWLMEQTLVHLLGGSPMASEMRCVRIVVTAAVNGLVSLLQVMCCVPVLCNFHYYYCCDN